MGRTLREVLASLPVGEQKAIEARFQELNQEVESLQALRQIAGKVQADVAAALHIKQPSVSRIEKQTDMYLSTLRGYVEAIGGELELIVRLPSRPPLRLQQLGDLFSAPDEDASEPAITPSPPRRSATAARGT
jgi:transcriptional regulator with XRE-family HTH domain